MTLATCTKDVHFYQWPSITHFGIYEPSNASAIKSISWACDGKELLAVRAIGCPVILELLSEDEIIEHDCEYINSATVGTFANHNPELVAFGGNCFVKIYNRTQINRPQVLIEMKTTVKFVNFSCNDEYLAVGCINGQIFIYNHNYELLGSVLPSYNPSVSTMAYSKTNPVVLAAGTKEGELCMWNTDTFSQLLYLQKHTTKITGIGFFDYNVSTIGLDGKYICYDVRAGNTSYCCDLDCPLTSFDYLNETYELAVSTSTGQIRRYDFRNMKQPLKTLLNGGIKKLAFSLNNNVTNLGCPLRVPKKLYDSSSASGDYVNPTPLPVMRKELLFSPVSLSDIFNFSVVLNDEEIDYFCEQLDLKLDGVVEECEENLLENFVALKACTRKCTKKIKKKAKKLWNRILEYLLNTGRTEIYNKMVEFMKEQELQMIAEGNLIDDEDDDDDDDEEDDTDTDEDGIYEDNQLNGIPTKGEIENKIKKENDESNNGL